MKKAEDFVGVDPSYLMGVEPGPLKGMLPIVSTVHVPRGAPFHLVMGSDGLGDVVNEHESFLCRGDFDAEKLMNSTRNRWETPSVVKKAGSDQVFKSDFRLGCDDISIAVAHVDA